MRGPRAAKSSPFLVLFGIYQEKQIVKHTLMGLKSWQSTPAALADWLVGGRRAWSNAHKIGRSFVLLISQNNNIHAFMGL